MSHEKNYSEVLAYAFSEGAELTGFDGPLVQGLSEGFKENLVAKKIALSIRFLNFENHDRKIASLKGDVKAKYDSNTFIKNAEIFHDVFEELAKSPKGKDKDTQTIYHMVSGDVDKAMDLISFLDKNSKRFKDAYGSKKKEGDSAVLRALFEATAKVSLDMLMYGYIVMSDSIAANKLGKKSVISHASRESMYMTKPVRKLHGYYSNGTLAKMVSKTMNEAYNGEMLSEDGIIDQAVKALTSDEVVKKLANPKLITGVTATAGVVALIIELPTIISKGYEMRQSVSDYFNKLASDMDLHMDSLAQDTQTNAMRNQEKFSDALRKISDKLAIDNNSAEKKAQKTTAKIDVDAAKEAKKVQNGETSGVGLAALL